MQMKTIWKFALDIGGRHLLDIPAGSKLLCVGPNPAVEGQVALWFEIETSGKIAAKSFEIVATGGTVPNGSDYVGSAICNPFVWHVYELRKS